MKLYWKCYITQSVGITFTWNYNLEFSILVDELSFLLWFLLFSMLYAKPIWRNLQELKLHRIKFNHTNNWSNLCACVCTSICVFLKRTLLPVWHLGPAIQQIGRTVSHFQFMHHFGRLQYRMMCNGRYEVSRMSFMWEVLYCGVIYEWRIWGEEGETWCLH